MSCVSRLTLPLVALVLIVGCGGGTEKPDGGLAGASFSVGSKEFTEQTILGQIAVSLLENAGASVDIKVGVTGTRNIRAGLEAGAIDMYWEYTGTGWVVILGRDVNAAPSDSGELYRQVAAAELDENHIVWLDPAPMNNTYALATAAGRDSDLNVTSLSEYAELANTNPEAATICGATEWLTRDDGLAGLEATYGFDLPDRSLAEVELSLIYELVRSGTQCNFGEVFATDGRIVSNDLVLLEDDQNFFLAYQVALTIREEVFDVYGDQLRALFNPVAAKLTNEVIRQLNARVDVDGEDPRVVAEEFLRENGLLE